MTKRILGLVGLFGSLCLGLALLNGPVAHAQSQIKTQRVLIVYDARNPRADGPAKIATLQRLLASVGVPTQTEALAHYHAGQLTTQKYQGVVTLVNWPTDHGHNAAFTRDRERFTGRQLHIGQDLSDAEARHLHATPQTRYHQQFTLRSGQSWQLLPFSENLTVLPSHGDRQLGQLQIQGTDRTTYAYGTVRGRYGYLPYLANDGLSLVLAMRTVAKLFHQTGTQRPLLTITGVTPYSDLRRLRQLGQQLAAANIPFAVSTTTVANNTALQGFSAFTRTLRAIERDNGVIFLQTPTVHAANAKSGNALEQLMVAQLNQLGQRQVIPVGLSAPAYWNQDKLLRRHGLQRASDVLLLPNPKTPVYAQRDNLGATYDRTWFGLSLRSLQTQRDGQLTPDHLALPTAITTAMPTSARQLTATMRQIKALPVTWYQPQQQLQTSLVSASATFAYRRGTYLLNGRAVTIGAEATGVPRYHFTRKNKVVLGNYFKYQGWILLGFFAVTTVVLVTFLVVGRRIYRRKFMR
ncbi:hypothetical protein [Levilactobacillus acidifarinae]|uniref:DUF2334 domain-containing protein n=1 Tax=Levilactobacillus acidifarinae DSM 19394 = JCM 15949 TaxID=1423715 RepID=A0A0R1LVZ0_9LACO|nr:hypothetical protein [Levilactobacillus acidifarinae]KRK96450.1 hypothetical protein FD25_GL001946 [Levilactobacillus acidifarinae DSM 19394]GEO68964.1 hypothetical protein LAC03_08740 [Levilactobacillus acidifarinae]